MQLILRAIIPFILYYLSSNIENKNIQEIIFWEKIYGRLHSSGIRSFMQQKSKSKWVTLRMQFKSIPLISELLVSTPGTRETRTLFENSVQIWGTSDTGK